MSRILLSILLFIIAANQPSIDINQKSSSTQILAKEAVAQEQEIPDEPNEDIVLNENKVNETPSISSQTEISDEEVSFQTPTATPQIEITPIHTTSPISTVSPTTVPAPTPLQLALPPLVSPIPEAVKCDLDIQCLMIKCLDGGIPVVEDCSCKCSSHNSEI